MCELGSACSGGRGVGLALGERGRLGGRRLGCPLLVRRVFARLRCRTLRRCRRRHCHRRGPSKHQPGSRHVVRPRARRRRRLRHGPRRAVRVRRQLRGARAEGHGGSAWLDRIHVWVERRALINGRRRPLRSRSGPEAAATDRRLQHVRLLGRQHVAAGIDACLGDHRRAAGPSAKG